MYYCWILPFQGDCLLTACLCKHIQTVCYCHNKDTVSVLQQQKDDKAKMLPFLMLLFNVECTEIKIRFILATVESVLVHGREACTTPTEPSARGETNANLECYE